jgi:MFS family permease
LRGLCHIGVFPASRFVQAGLGRNVAAAMTIRETPPPVPALVSAIAPVFAAIFILIAGNGLQNTLVPMRGALEGFSPTAIGVVGSVYFIGMLAGSWAAPPIIRRVGHIRAFAAYAAVAGSATLSFSIFVNPWAWGGARMIVGFCLAGLYSAAESWLNDKAENTNRGRVLGAYNVVHFCGSATGQQILRLDDPKSFALFSGAGALFMLSMVPLAMTRTEPPKVPERGRIDVRGIYRASPLAAVGVFLIGWANGSFWSLLPVYGTGLGLTSIQIADLMTVLILGCALGPFPVGWISDRTDRRYVLAGLALCAFAIEVGLTIVGKPSIPLLYVCAFLLGVCIPVMYGQLQAHTADRAGRERMLEISSTLLFIYCLGAILGPFTASEAMARFGPAAFQVHNAAIHLALALFVLWRLIQRGKPPASGTAEGAQQAAQTARRTVG